MVLEFGEPGVRGRVGMVILVLRTFLELVWRSVQNLVEIGPTILLFHKYKGTSQPITIKQTGCFPK